MKTRALRPVLLALPFLLLAPRPAPAQEAAPADGGDLLKKLFEEELGADRYNSEGRRDPFVSLQRPVAAESGPRQRRPGMEGFLVQEVALKGIVKTPDGYIAMLLGPDNKSYFVHVGQPLYDGVITAMDGATVTFRQEVTDPLARQKTRDVVKTLYPAEEAR